MPMLQLQVSQDVADIIHEKVASGRFASAEAFVSDAILWMGESSFRDDEDRQLAELRAIIQIGIDQADRGEAAPYSYEEMMADLKNDVD
jgi:Arc/MetJ-type ribon-helix-helix transcriptional regulator